MYDDIPGQIYLCQINEKVSCGACCGLYNVVDPSLDHIEELLTFRTGTYQKTPRDLQSLIEFENTIKQHEHMIPPLEEFHHCRYLGLIGENHQTVGCLLHPKNTGNQDIDWRGLSDYGGLACRTYFCPTHQKVNPTYKQIIKSISSHWYMYGLIITEADLINAFFDVIGLKLKTPLIKDDFLDHPGHKQMAIDFFNLKLTWPFNPSPANRACHYFFNDGFYARKNVVYDFAPGFKHRFDAVFKELGSRFRTENDLREAEQIIEKIILR